MKPLGSIFIIFSIVLWSCRSDSSPDARQVADYLHSVGLTKSDTMLYCFIPGNQCRNCFYYQGTMLHDFTNKHLQIVTEFPQNHFTGFLHVVSDTTQRMLSLPLLHYGNRFIRFQNGQVNAIPLTNLYTQADSLASQLRLK